jgi:DNA gyrase subunit A
MVAYFAGARIDVNVNGRKSAVNFPGKKPEKGFDARQADAILELQLHRLTRLSVDEITGELAEIRGRIEEYEAILGSEKKLRAVIIKELEEVRKQYGDARRTQILDETAEIQLEDLIADEQVAVTMSHSGYLKRTNTSTYRSQRRGGSGRRGMATREDDFVEKLFIASTHDYMLIFSNTGKVFWLKVYEIPDVGAAGKGKHISSLIALQPGESVRALLKARDLEDPNSFVFFATRNGTVKKTALVEFSNVRAGGIIAISIDKGDELVSAAMTSGDDIIFLASHEGMAIRFEEKYEEGQTGGVRSMGRNAGGVRGMDLDDGDYIVGMAVTPKQSALSGQQSAAPPAPTTSDQRPTAGAEEPLANLILTVTENGYGKRTAIDEYRLQSRGGKGVINVKTTARNGKVVASLLVSEESQGMVISQYGQIIRIPTQQVREAGRATQGVRLLSLDEGDRVAAAVVIPNGKEEEENGLIQ